MCPNFRFVEGRFLMNNTESPASAKYSVSGGTGMNPHTITFTTPFNSFPFILVTTERNAGTASATVVYGSVSVNGFQVNKSTSTQAIQFLAISCLG